MSYRKRKETKQQTGTAGPGNILGCCLVSLHFLCDIYSIHSVHDSRHERHGRDVVAGLVVVLHDGAHPGEDVAAPAVLILGIV